MDKKIIGVNSGHNASACLIIGHKIVNAIEKERLTRVKHDHGDPVECIDYLLESNGLKHEDIDLLVYAGWENKINIDKAYYRRFKEMIFTYEHHFLHALSSYATSPFDKEICLVIDGHGAKQKNISKKSIFYAQKDDYETESVYIFDHGAYREYDKKFSLNRKNKYAWGGFLDSLGYMYGIASSAIFGHANYAGKTMGLSAFGKENKAIPYPILFDKHTFKINRNWLSFIESNWNIHWDTDLAKDIAYSSQKSLEDYYEYRVKNLVEEIQIRNVSLSGGVALNCKNNGLMSNYDFIDKLFVFNACSDSGISVGAAAYGLLHLTKRVHKLKWSSGLGRKYITSDKISVHIDEIVKILLQDEVVGVFQDGSEFGPRALGNRSIIASPLNPFMKDKINHLIKHRESFRPFGGSILRKHLSIISDDKYCSDHMLSAFKVKDEFVNKILSVVHEDGTSRLHIIDDEQSLIGSVLNHFYQITGVPVLINTSFNGNYEPIIETYENAMETCKKNNINYLITPSNIIKIK